VRSVTHDGAAVLCDHHVDAVSATRELVGQDFATKEALAASVQARNLASAASGYASADFVGAAGAGVLNAPGNLHGRRWRAAHGCWLTAAVVVMGEQAGFGRSCCNKREGGRSGTPHDQTT